MLIGCLVLGIYFTFLPTKYLNKKSALNNPPPANGTSAPVLAVLVVVVVVVEFVRTEPGRVRSLRIRPKLPGVRDRFQQAERIPLGYRSQVNKTGHQQAGQENGSDLHETLRSRL